MRGLKDGSHWSVINNCLRDGPEPSHCELCWNYNVSAGALVRKHPCCVKSLGFHGTLAHVKTVCLLHGPVGVCECVCVLY